MSQQKAQLVSPIDTFTPPGINVTGVVTATSFVGSGGTVTALASGSNLNVGVITATFYGDGSGLSGVAAAGYVGQTTAAQSGTTTIDLSAGNVIYFTQDTDTTVAFASTQAVQEVLFIRTKDDTTDARSITWPSSILWDGGTAPTLIDSSDGNDVQIFNLTTRDQGVTWYGYEAMKNDPAEPVASGALFSFGHNYYGQLAQNDVIPRSSPVQVPGTQWTSVTSLLSGTMAVKSDGTLWLWGYNLRGQLGQNDVTSYSSPVQVPGTTWSTATNKIASDSDSVSAIKTDGTLWVWGRGDSGELAQNDVIDYSSPVQIPGTQWDNVLGTNGYRMMVSKTDGTLWAWGNNGQGKLGQNDTANRSSPVQIPGNQWSKIGSGYIHGIATKTDGTLWIWGQYLYGQLGLNDAVNRSSPHQIPGTQWTDVGRARYSSFAFKTGNELWVWGSNAGQLGQNDVTQYSSPRQIPGTQWDKLTDAGMGYNAVMTKSDDTLWVWGRGDDGQLGLNEAIPRSSPYQIPGTGWVDFGSTYQSGHYIRTL